MLMWLCAAAGAAWLLQFIEDLQQSREFHKVCELKLPNEAATIPEVLLFLSPYSVSYQHAAVNTTSQHEETICYSTLHAKPILPLSTCTLSAHTGGCLSPSAPQPSRAAERGRDNQ